MMHGTYNGKDPRYKGEGALLMHVRPGIVKAQFDNLERFYGKEAHSWTEFKIGDFCIEKSEWTLYEIERK